jgi:hypothetical protein
MISMHFGSIFASVYVRASVKHMVIARVRFTLLSMFYEGQDGRQYIVFHLTEQTDQETYARECLSRALTVT